jgi:membrane fusion protein (multidrug efflux system)
VAGTFDQTMRALRADRPRGAWLIGSVTAVMLVGWIAWMSLAEVPVFESSGVARLEVLPAPSQLGALVAGRVVRVELQVGKRVAVGEMLVELDASTQRVELERARGQLQALEPELASLDREIAAEQKAVTAGDAAGRAAVREQIAKQREADEALAHAEAELARLSKLAASGVVATMEVDQAKAELQQKRTSRQALGHAADSLAAAEQERDAGRRARMAELDRQRASVAGSIAAARSDVARLELVIDRHVVRSPVAGTLGSVASLQTGAIVAEGTPIATVVPDGELQVVAQFGPSSIGRLAPGQIAKLKLDGFPWTRWGTVAATVTRVANELRDGTIRVELAIEPGAEIPLAHGMTGAVDVEVERVSPATLLLRSLVQRSAAGRGARN